jgi:hypothetical protein
MIRFIGTLASLAWLAFMTWGAVREYKATHPTGRVSAPGIRMLLERLNAWLAQRTKKALDKGTLGRKPE